MVSITKLHKLAGLSAGLVLLLLGVTGFFLDHDKWSFLYTTTLKHLPQASQKIDNKLYDSYWIDPKDSKHIIVGGKRGLFESYNTGKSFILISSLQILGLRQDSSGIYLATSDGIYTLQNSKLLLFGLKNEYITSISLSPQSIVAVVDKHTLVKLSKVSHSILSRSIVEIPKPKLIEDIKLSRFVRDLHYGRGLFEGDISLLINDYGAIIVSFLALSGYIIWWIIHSKSAPKLARKLIRLHSNIFVILSLIPLVILAITGIFLDHADGLGKFMSSITIKNSFLPPVYSSLKYDIWSVDYDGKVYRIGNRYGIYKSDDLKHWDLENRGLAYKMIRKNDALYVSGMGAPNRIYKDSWQILPHTPHMFRDVFQEKNKILFFSPHQSSMPLPKLKETTLYALLLSIHDGSFFSSWWIWINDYASFALLLLGFTGTLRWNKRRKSLQKAK